MRLNCKSIIYCLLFLFVCSLCLAKDTPTKDPQNPLVTITGRVISKGRNIFLINAKGKVYLLKRTKTLRKAFNEVKKYADKDTDVIISCLDTGEERGSRFFDYKTRKATETKYRILQVAFFHKVEQPSKVTNLSLNKPIAYRPPPLVPPSPPMVISGKISRCNFKSIIPTIELKGKEGFVFMLTSETQAAKVMDGKLVQFKPKEVLKVGAEVEILYRQQGYQNIAQIITIAADRWTK